MTFGDEWLILDSVESTQAVAAERLLANEPVGVVFAHDQTQGKGRHGRTWSSQHGQSLTMSIAMPLYAGMSKPWLLGMAVALTVAETLDCQTQWPNDLVLNGKKLGGVLTELVSVVGVGAVPVIGVGLNIGQTQFPQSLPFATSLFMASGRKESPLTVARQIVGALRSMTTPLSWLDLAEAWNSRDATPGKSFRTPSGDVVVATTIGKDGELIAASGERLVTVYAADAWFGGTAGD